MGKSQRPRQQRETSVWSLLQAAQSRGVCCQSLLWVFSCWRTSTTSTSAGLVAQWAVGIPEDSWNAWRITPKPDNRPTRGDAILLFSNMREAHNSKLSLCTMFSSSCNSWGNKECSKHHKNLRGKKNQQKNQLDCVKGYSTHQDQKLGSGTQRPLQIPRDFNKLSYKPLTSE